MTRLRARSGGIRLQVLAVAASAAGLTCPGCASDDDARGPWASSLAQTSPPAPSIDAGTTAPYVATITASGTGCPRDRWESHVSSDGSTITTSFESFEAQIQAGSRTSFKDCNLTMKLHSAEPLAFAVRRFTHAGAALVEPGVRGFITASHAFRGNAPTASSERRLDIAGPADFCFAPSEPLRDEDLVWSPCGRDNTLTILNRIGLQKTQEAGAGYIDLCDVDTRCGGPFKLGLTWRACHEESIDAGTPVPENAAAHDAAAP